MVVRGLGMKGHGLGLAAALGGWLASSTGCVLYDDVGPASTELYALIELHCQSATTCGCGWAGQDQATCIPELEARWKARLSEGQRRGLVYDAACMAFITETIERYECYWPGGPTPLCAELCSVYHGDLSAGARCETTDPLVTDCAQGLVCNDGECVDPCTVLGGRAEGEPCRSELFGLYDDCAPGLWCSGSSHVCEPKAGLGQPCSYGACDTNLRCDWRTGSCVTAPQEGQSCTEIDCADGLYCEWIEYDTAICERQAAEGESCEQRQCAYELYCDPNLRCVTAPGEGEPCLWGSECSDDTICDAGTCVARPEAGSPCLQGACGGGAWCSVTNDDPNGTCMAPQPVGEMCSGHTQCSSRYCPNGFCWPAPAEGEDCSTTGTCGPGLVCNGTTCETTITRGPAACIYPGW